MSSLTNSNSKRIVYKLNLDNFDASEEIFHIKFKWFSKYEKKGLLAFKLLFQNPEEFFRKYKPRKAIDTRQYVFEGQASAHHKDPSCERILSSFHNYKLPEEIKEKGEEAIQEFRNWFKEHSHLMEDKMDLFLDKLKWKFGLEERPDVVDYKNSGVEIIENLNLEELESEIENKIEKTISWYNSSNKIRVMLDNFGVSSYIYKDKRKPYYNRTNYSNKEIWTVLREFEEEYKTPITFMLREYYKVKYNPELKFEGSLLEQLGFEPCRQCYDSKYIDEFERRDNKSQHMTLDRNDKFYDLYNFE